MAKVALRNITKSFADVVAVKDVSIQVEHGEFFTLLGPSGCGKTTLLKTIAGFYLQDKGNIFFDKRLIDTIPAHKRNTGMVFQNYAIFPHLNVFDNIAYGLKERKFSARVIKEKVESSLRLVNLGGFEKRMAHQLSGGQQQRVVIARSLVIEPEVLLFDEPLSNLDAKLREQMRNEIKNLQKKLKITTIYVTHDQEEALCISDRIAVMNSGEVIQVGTPYEIYWHPEDLFVANFIGLANTYRAKVISSDLSKSIVEVNFTGIQLKIKSDMNLLPNREITFSVRPESIHFIDGEKKTEFDNLIRGKIDNINFLGSYAHYEIKLSNGEMMRAEIHNPKRASLMREGNEVNIGFDEEDILLFAKDGDSDAKISG